MISVQVHGTTTTLRVRLNFSIPAFPSCKGVNCLVHSLFNLTHWVILLVVGLAFASAFLFKRWCRVYTTFQPVQANFKQKIKFLFPCNLAFFSGLVCQLWILLIVTISWILALSIDKTIFCSFYILARILHDQAKSMPRLQYDNLVTAYTLARILHKQAWSVPACKCDNFVKSTICSWQIAFFRFWEKNKKLDTMRQVCLEAGQKMYDRHDHVTELLQSRSHRIRFFVFGFHFSNSEL